MQAASSSLWAASNEWSGKTHFTGHIDVHVDVFCSLERIGEVVDGPSFCHTAHMMLVRIARQQMVVLMWNLNENEKLDP